MTLRRLIEAQFRHVRAKEFLVAKSKNASRDNKVPSNGNWVTRDSSGRSYVSKKADSYGSFKGHALPPPGRNNIIVRTPNPLPSPKESDS